MTKDKKNSSGNSQEETDFLDKMEILKHEFEIAVELRNLEITQLTNRNNFYMIFQGVLLAGVVQSSHEVPIISFMSCLVGVLISWVQLQTSLGAKYWQDKWENSTLKAYQKLHSEYFNNDKSTDFPIFGMSTNKTKEKMKEFYKQGVLKSDDERKGWLKRMFGKTKKPMRLINWLIMTKPSVSRAPIYASMVLIVTWACLFVATISGSIDIPEFIAGFRR